MALALASLNAARGKHKELVAAGCLLPMRVGLAVSSRERVGSLLKAWKVEKEARNG